MANNNSSVLPPLTIENIDRERAIGLFTFLRELTELRSSTIRSVDQYERVLWFHDVPQEPECHCVAWTRGDSSDPDEAWLEIRKPPIKDPPEVPPKLTPWLNLAEVRDSSRDLPDLRTEIVITRTVTPGEDADVRMETEVIRIEDNPEVKQIWERYVEQKWWPWAEEDRRLQRIQDVYNELFSIYQRQQRLGEQYEVVLALGLLTWKSPDGQEIRRHLITAQTNLTFDATRGKVTVGPAGEGARPTLEQDMIDPQYRPDPREMRGLEEQVAEISDDVWNPARLDSALSGWVHSVSGHGAFESTLEPQERIAETPKVRLAPAIILRRRTERSFIRVFSEIIDQLRVGQPIPQGVRQFLRPDAGERANGEGGSSESDGASEIYFPLEANPEQLKIIERLSGHRGVLVQGPPGTGKSHTIVNLICHLLASGQRLLVTSHTARALEVLRHYIQERAKEIAPLAVVLLGDDRKSLQAMEDSVHGITGRHNAWDPEQNTRQIAKNRQQLDNVRRQEAEILQEIRALRERETYRHSARFGGYEGTAQEIAVRLRREAPEYSWLSDPISESQEPPLTNEQAIELLALLRDKDVRQAESSSWTAIDPSAFLLPSDLAALVRRLADAERAFSDSATFRQHPSYAHLRRMDGEKRDGLARELEIFVTAVESLTQHIQPWVKQSVRDILAEQDRPWRELARVSRAHLDAMGDRAHEADEMKVTWPLDRDRYALKSDAEELLRHLEAGGRLGFGPIGPAVVRRTRYLSKVVYVNGRLCDRPDVLRKLIFWVDVYERLDALHGHWSEHAEISSTSLSRLVASYHDLMEPLDDALQLHHKMANLRAIFSEAKGLKEPVWYQTGDLRELLAVLRSIQAEENLASAKAEMDRLEASIRHVVEYKNVDPSAAVLAQAIRTRDIEGYASNLRTLTVNYSHGERLKRRRHLEADAPPLARAITQNPEDQIWNSRVSQFSGAWNWGRAKAWMTRLSDPAAEEHLHVRLDDCRHRIKRFLHEIAAALAWAHCFGRMTDHQRQHLIAWEMAMRRIGRGTGRYAATHRRAAQEHMQECRSAIPAWIMPLYRVASTVRPGTDLFDVAVIDEASQSGPEALLLLYLAKRIIVVGDDKQISPDFVGINREDVNQIRARHIAELPHNDAYGVDNSFFDLAHILFGGRIRLREHFRCMPEIIQFSNNLCYRAEPLIPLKQFGGGRLSPVIETRHVRDGYLQGGQRHVMNPPEAEAIADTISSLCKAPTYEGKTIGVISLLGETQARRIESLLLERLGPEEMERRKLVCGDAYAFQGDERDVIFLSLVTAPQEGRRIGTLTSQRDERRFNVAASRSREQLWLFHTATLNDLSPSCLRYRLLEYCQNPHLDRIGTDDLDLEGLRRLASSPDRPSKPPPPFDSWFEVDVCLQIGDRGYRVIPQYDVAGYYIDLLVEGMQGNLAVECDGDQWHGPERYLEDMQRQRNLERCGRIFWRIRGSTFYSNPEHALDGLWETLKRHQIHAVTGASETPQNSEETVDLPRSDHTEMEEAAPTNEANAQDLPELPLQEPERAPDKLSTLMDAAYIRWPTKPLPDPRYASIAEIIPGLIEIVRAEGPILCDRVYHIFAKAAGIQRLGLQVRSGLNKALWRALKQGTIGHRIEIQSKSLGDRVLRMPGSPTIVVRPRSDREFDEIPPSEVAMLMARLRQRNAAVAGENLHRAVLSQYEVKRMARNISVRLATIEQRMTELLAAPESDGNTGDVDESN